MKAARGYCRVSSPDQLKGVSLTLQQKKIEEFCLHKNLTLVKVYIDEAISGKNLNRPAVQLLLSELSPGETVVINDLSRISRNVRDTVVLLDSFKEKGVNLMSVEEHLDFSTPEGKGMLELTIKLNQLEREQTSRKVSEAMTYLSEQGQLRSRPPFGWKFAGKDQPFEECPEQQAVIAKIKQLHSLGMNLSQITRALNDMGLNKTLTLNKKTKDKAQLFYPQSVKRILIDCGIIVATPGCIRSPIESRLAFESKEQKVEEMAKTASERVRNAMTPSGSEVDNRAHVIISPSIEAPVSEERKEMPVFRSSDEKLEKKVRFEAFLREQRTMIDSQRQEARKSFEELMQIHLARLDEFEQNLSRHYASLEAMASKF